MLSYEYVAGIIDGEGTIGITHHVKKNEYVPYIAISNTNYKVLSLIRNTFLKDGIQCYITNKKARNVNHKHSYTLSVRWKPAIKLAKKLYDFLIIKKKNAKILAEEFETCTPRNGKYTKILLNKKLKLITKIKKLNSRGI